MVRFSCSRISEDMTPVIRDIEIAKFAEKVLCDHRPELLDVSLYGDDPYYEPALLNPYDFAEKYLGANLEIHDIYTESSRDVIAGAAVFNEQKVKVFDKDRMCTREILVEPNTILLDNGTVDRLNKGFEFFTVMHEAGHLMMHQMVYRKDPDTDDGTVLCKRSNIGRSPDGLRTGEDFREHQANTFAASMLMPPRLFIPYVQGLMKRNNRFDDEIMITWSVNDGSNKYWRYREIVRLAAQQFGVSRRAAEVQLTKYGLQAPPKDDRVKEARRRLRMYQSLYR